MTYCSSKVSDQRLKEFTCPINANKCPSGKEAILDITKVKTTFTLGKQWTNIDFNAISSCKYNIKYSGE